MYINLRTLSFLALLTLLAAVSWPQTQSTAAAPIMQSLTWQGEDFAQGAGADTAVSPTGLTLEDAAFTAVYTADPIHTPIGFNALVTSWEADVPADTSWSAAPVDTSWSAAPVDTSWSAAPADTSAEGY